MPERPDEIIVIGDNVELILDDNRVYKTKIEDAADPGLFLVAVPSLGGIPAHLYINDRISFGFYRTAGRYATTMEVVAFEKQNLVNYVWLMQMAPAYKQQRRDAYRLPVSIRVQVCEYIDDIELNLPLYGDLGEETLLESVNTMDISITGIALKSSRPYESGEKYLLKIYFAGQQGESRPLLVCAEVMRCLPTHEPTIKKIGMRYYGETRNRGDILSRYIFTQQQKLIKQRKLIDIG